MPGLKQEDKCEICGVEPAVILYYVECNKIKEYEHYTPKLQHKAICKECDREMWELIQKRMKEIEEANP